MRVISIVFKTFLVLLGVTLVTGFIPNQPDPNLIARVIKRHSRSGVGILVDYDYPIHMKRLWVVATRTVRIEGKVFKRGDVILNTHVSHSWGSGMLFATRFSNVPNSFISSRGFFRTHQKRHRSHHHGWPALRVDGLDRKLNRNAKARAIIFHRSYSPWSAGCFMSLPSMNDRLTKLAAGGAIMYVHKTNPVDLNDIRRARP